MNRTLARAMSALIIDRELRHKVRALLLDNKQQPKDCIGNLHSLNRMKENNTQYMENDVLMPLYSGSIVKNLESLFKKPAVSKFDVISSIIELSKKMDPDDFSRQTASFRKNKNLFSEDLDWYIAKDPHPLPVTEDRELYDGNQHAKWWCRSLVNFMQIYKLNFDLAANNEENELTYFEIGCASGRVLRHALLQAPVPMRVIGCDTNIRHIEWIRRFLPRESGQIFHNTILPSLPLPDNSIDILVGLSVFTHIDDLEFAWLMELRRIMKAGALAFCTVMTEMTWDRIGNDPNYSGAIDAFKNKYPMPYKASAKDYKKPMPRERMVFWAPGSPIYNSDVYHHSEYVRREWGRFFDVVEILPAHLDLQDLVVLQKI